MMKRLAFLCLLFIAVSSQSINQTAFDLAEETCPFALVQHVGCPLPVKSNKVPQLLPPLVGRVGLGYDPVKRKALLPVLAMTYDINYTTPDHKYRVPDSVQFTSQNVQQPSYKTFRYDTLPAWLQDMSFDQNSIMGGVFGEDPSVLSDYTKFFSGSASFLISVETRNAYTLKTTSLAAAFLDPLFLKALQYLPKTYDPDSYGEFVEYWGTSVIVSADFGGIVSQVQAQKSCSFDIDGVSIQDQSAYQLMLSLGYQGYSAAGLNTQYTSRQKSYSVEMLGGDPVYIQPNQWPLRIPTIYAAPVITNLNKVPITQFISDPTIKQNTQLYIDSYMKTAQSARQQAASTAEQEFLGPQWVFGTRGESPYFAASKFYIFLDGPPPNWVFPYLPLIQQSITPGHGFLVQPVIWKELNYPGLLCWRDGNGYVMAGLQYYAGNNYFVPNGPIINGSPVKEGCSISYMPVKFFEQGKLYTNVQQGQCCINMIATFPNPYVPDVMYTFQSVCPTM